VKLWFISREPLNVGTIGHRGAKMTASDWSRADNWEIAREKRFVRIWQDSSVTFPIRLNVTNTPRRGPL